MITIFGKKKEIKAEEKKPSTQQSQMMELAGGDSTMFELLSRFIFLDPEKQQAKDAGPYIEVAQEERAGGNLLRARVNYDLAAMMSIYRNDKETTRKMATEALAVSTADTDRRVHKALLDNLDKFMELAKIHFDRKNAAASAEQLATTPVKKR